MSHPFELISHKKRPWAFLALLTFTAVIMTVMNFAGAPLKTAEAPNGIVSYELAGYREKAAAILESWDPHARLSAAFQLGLDYLFMAAYSCTIALACVMGARVFLQRGSAILATTGILVAWAQWIAALFDALENAGLTVMLLGQVSSLWAQVAFGAAVIKFTLILLGLAYAAAAGAVSLLSKPRPAPQRLG